MAISEKCGLKKNQYTLFAIAASLAIGNLSSENNVNVTNAEGFSPSAKFFSVENRGFSIGCELEQNLLDSKSV